MHPTPAIAGDPKEYTVEYLFKKETYNRGLYSGPFGYIYNKTSEFLVSIRSCRIQKKYLYLYSGAGIISSSNPTKEWEELNNKITPFIDILENQSMDNFF